jgi:multiple sugar transport system permease protein
MTSVALDSNEVRAEDSRTPVGPRLDKARMSWTSIPLLSPAFILLAVLFIGPVVFSIYLGFTNLQLVGPHSLYYQVTGTENLSRLVHDTTFRQSIVLTLVFVLGSAVIGATVLGFVLALAMQSSLALIRGLVGVIVLVAFMFPPIVVSLCWIAATRPGGIFATLTGSSGGLLLTQPLLVVSAANAWNLAGLAMLLFSAALRNIPGDILESAKMENASAFQRLMKITLPMLRPVFVTTMLLMTLLALANFTVVYIMTNGGPGTSTMIMPVYSYVQGFNYNELGYGALIGNVMVLLAALLSIVYVRVSRSSS